MADSKLLILLQRLVEDARFLLDSEEATKQGIILPILSRIGWDRDNVREVIPEYRVKDGRVDYCLHINHKNAVFIEAKRTDQELDRHQEQLLDYAFREGVKLAVLTNGVVWWLYLPLLQGSWEQRRFFTIDISQQGPSAVADHFSRFLSRDAVADGSAVRRAEALHESRAKERLTTSTLPRAWQQLLSEPDELLSELLADRVASLCGHQPTPEQVKTFLTNFTVSAVPLPAPRPQTTLPTSETRASRSRRVSDTFAYKDPQGFRFLDTRYTASRWREVLVILCTELSRRHPDTFNKVLQLKGRTRTYFDQNPQNLRSPSRIPGTSIFVETNLSADTVVQRCEQVLQILGYSPDDFEVITE